jgi:hypothetical protein
VPTKDGKYLKPEDAMAQGLCPECGIDLKSVNPIGHLNFHWVAMPRNDRGGLEALRRRAMLLDYIQKNDIRTSNDPRPKKGEPEKPKEPVAPAA